MKLFALLAALVMGLGAAALVMAADDAKPQAPAEGKTEAKADEKTPATKPSTQAAIFNKKCPLSDEDVDHKGKTVTYKGKTIGFCCDDCVKDFNKDPDKYAKKLGIEK